MPCLQPHVESTASRGSRKPLLTDSECKAIAAVFDGSSSTIDALLADLRKRYPHLKRHNVSAAARRGGYVTDKLRKAWSQQEDDFIRNNWHLLSGDEVASQLGRTFDSVNLRRKRLRVGGNDGADLTIRDVEEFTGLDHRLWHGFIEQGWISARDRGRRNGAPPVTYVTLTNLRRFFRKHPEVFDYRNARPEVRQALRLDTLPEPPRFMRVMCRSNAWNAQVKPTVVGPKWTHGAAQVEDVLHRFKEASCSDEGGVSFWARTYSSPVCPRCGCVVSRFSPEAVFTDDDPGEEEILDIKARKLGLRWKGGALRDHDGVEVKDRELLFHVFRTDRNPGKAVKIFEKLIQAGLKVVDSAPVERSLLLPNILNIELRPDQEEALEAFCASGAITAAHCTSFGKSTLGMMVTTRLAGRHVWMTNTTLLRDQLIEKLVAAAPKVDVCRKSKPSMVQLTVYERDGTLRSTIDIFTYRTHAALPGPYVCFVSDETQHLPGRYAHRHATVECQYRLGLSATLVREDGRGAMCEKLTGPAVGADWRDQMEGGTVKKVPVRVLIVKDVEHKHEIVAELARNYRVAVFVEALADGAEIEKRYGIPFVCSKTPNKLDVVRSATSICFSRVGDCGVSMQDIDITIDHTGHFGSRMQSLQRLGRLMHSHHAICHIVLMTPALRERFAKRIDVIREKGFDVSEESLARFQQLPDGLPAPAVRERETVATSPPSAAPSAKRASRVARPPPLRDGVSRREVRQWRSQAGEPAPVRLSLAERVPAGENMFLSLLGWRRIDAKVASGGQGVDTTSTRSARMGEPEAVDA